MARDVFVYFKKGKKPSRAELQTVLEDYTAGLAREVRWQSDRFIVTLPGTVRNPLVRVLPKNTPHARAAQAEVSEATERWFEVWIGTDCVDIITRMMDEVTNSIAYGFAKLCARWWSGEIEE